MCRFCERALASSGDPFSDPLLTGGLGFDAGVDEFGYGGGRSLAAAAKVAQAARPFSLSYAEKLEAERCAAFSATRIPVVFSQVF